MVAEGRHADPARPHRPRLPPRRATWTRRRRAGASSSGCVERDADRRARVPLLHDEPYSLELVAGEPAGPRPRRRSSSHRTARSTTRAPTWQRSASARSERRRALFLPDPDGRAIQLMPAPRPGARRTVAAARALARRPCTPARRAGSGTSTASPATSTRTSVLHGGARHADHRPAGRGRCLVPHRHRPPRDGARRDRDAALPPPRLRRRRHRPDARPARPPRASRPLVSWGPTRHGIGGNIASYVRIVEEPCLVELYCDMEQLADDHEPRV